jgi:FtsP/CotA-like multicopper oxidase with cupredoxin domain
MQKRSHHMPAAANEHFPAETAGLPEPRPSEIINLSDGDEFDLGISSVAKRVGDATVRMLAYNGSIPGPTLKVPQGSEVVINVSNKTDLPSTVHWHGLRLENAYDGTHETQAPIPHGGTFAYRLRFPDPGIYWYHPHIREDYGQEMGLYANILVVPADPDYWPPAHREVLLTLDDVLIEDGKIALFGREETNYAAMGRFGNVMLVGGEVNPSLSAQPGAVLRFYLTNTANARVFNVAIPGARMKLVGGDSGRHEREEFVDSVILAPSERAVIDVLFEQAQQLTLEHRTPERNYSLATINVSGAPATPSLAETFAGLRHNQEWVDERERLAGFFDARPDKTLAIVAEMDMGAPEGPVVYACPMHADAVSDQPGRCPKCGMKLLATAAPARYVCPMHLDVVSAEAGRCPKCGMKLLPSALVAGDSGDGANHKDGQGDPGNHAESVGHGRLHGHDAGQGGHVHGRHGAPAQEHHGHEVRAEPSKHEHGAHGGKHDQSRHGQTQPDPARGIEWEDDMVDVNRITTSANTRWSFVDRETGAVNHAIKWTFRVGDQVKLRLVNEMDSDHPMHHPFHVHGAGRFVVLARGGVAEPNLVWKDTVLVRTGETVDILLDVTNPGVWMAHCHIAEHHESGMMFSFNVAPAAGPRV